jgi:hypothetical protein
VPEKGEKGCCTYTYLINHGIDNDTYLYMTPVGGCLELFSVTAEPSLTPLRYYMPLYIIYVAERGQGSGEEIRDLVCSTSFCKELLTKRGCESLHFQYCYVVSRSNRFVIICICFNINFYHMSPSGWAGAGLRSTSPCSARITIDRLNFGLMIDRHRHRPVLDCKSIILGSNCNHISLNNPPGTI